MSEKSISNVQKAKGWVKLLYGFSVTTILSSYVIANCLIGLVLFLAYQPGPNENLFDRIAQSASPLYTAESLALTFFACSLRSKYEPKIFRDIKDKVDLLGILALGTAVLAVLPSLSLKHWIASSVYIAIIVLGFYMLFKEAIKLNKKGQSTTTN